MFVDYTKANFHSDPDKSTADGDALLTHTTISAEDPTVDNIHESVCTSYVWYKDYVTSARFKGCEWASGYAPNTA